MNTLFFINSALLGVGLAMDAFSVSVANGLSQPDMSRALRLSIPGTFALFQFLMPLVGWFCVRTIAEAFLGFKKAVPWIALVLLVGLGARMLVEAARHRTDDAPRDARITPATLLMQGVATSIDALSVGFTIAGYALFEALIACAVIAAVTFALCALGLFAGRRFASRLAGKATALGGIILILIGVEIFVRGL